MQRLFLAVALFATMLWRESSTPAQAGIGIYPEGVVACQPLPFGYPRGWELMVRYPCSPYYAYGPYYGPPGYYPVGAAYPHRRSSFVDHGIHRRPYLRPGWWW